MCAALQRRELLRVAGVLSDEMNLPFAEATPGTRIDGVYRRSVELVSGRFALIEKSREFTLVRWRPILDRQIGKSVYGSCAHTGSARLEESAGSANDHDQAGHPGPACGSPRPDPRPLARRGAGHARPETRETSRPDADQAQYQRYTQSQSGAGLQCRRVSRDLWPDRAGRGPHPLHAPLFPGE